jgi:DNA-binding SARP family transcriptional activator
VSVRLSLLRGFELSCDGDVVRLPLAAQRLLAFLALQDRALRRVYVAGMLWLDATEERAYANLRSALWRVSRESGRLVRATPTELQLGSMVEVDVRRVIAASCAVIDHPDGGADDYLAQDLGGELLPDWYDSWVDDERTRLRQLRLHALETVAERLLHAGSYGKAVDAGLVALRSDPLRESAHRVLIRIYLAEGNASEALRQYSLYKRRLHEELGLEPSAQMEELVRDLRPSSRLRRRAD